MKPDSLRAEYVLTGGALLAGLSALILAWQHRAGDSRYWDFLTRVSEDSPLFSLGILVGGSYIAGIVCVQLTFFLPTEGLIDIRRSQRWGELWDADSDLCSKWTADPEVADAALLQSAFHQRQSDSDAARPVIAQFGRFYWKRVTDLPGLFRGAHGPKPKATDSLALSLGRQLATTDVTREYEYRRSNRQVFVGVLPGACLALAAALVNPWLGPGFDFGVLALTGGIGVIGAAFIMALISSAAYQEKIAQAQLLDTAFAARWKGADPTACPTCRVNSQLGP